MKKVLYPLLGIAVLAGLTFFVRAPNGASDAEDPLSEPIPVAVVSAVSASSEIWPQVVVAQGAIAPWQEAVVGARVSGLTLVEISADVGDTVVRGQMLASFDARTVEADISQAEANLAEAKAMRKQAQVNKDRVLALGKSSAISEQDILQAVTTADTTIAQVSAAEASLKSLQIRLDDTQVIAPDDGVITARSATLGQVPQPGSELFRMIRQGRLEWRAELNPSQFAAVRPGMTAKLTLPDGTTTTGTVRQRAASLDNQTRLGLAYVDIEPDSNARAGMFASGRLELGNAPAVVVPAASIVIRDGRSLLFRLRGSVVDELGVDTGRREGDLIEILSGVSPGDKLVLKGAGFLNNGDLVKVVDDPDATGDTGDS
ncbi:MAG: efflux RND transporter periplasmic adaptor subunit [Pseudomonadota bacterium]